jgi:hypothetical protein
MATAIQTLEEDAAQVWKTDIQPTPMDIEEPSVIQEVVEQVVPKTPKTHVTNQKNSAWNYEGIHHFKNALYDGTFKKTQCMYKTNCRRFFCSFLHPGEKQPTQEDVTINRKYLIRSANENRLYGKACQNDNCEKGALCGYWHKRYEGQSFPGYPNKSVNQSFQQPQMVKPDFLQQQMVKPAFPQSYMVKPAFPQQQMVRQGFQQQQMVKPDFQQPQYGGMTRQEYYEFQEFQKYKKLQQNQFHQQTRV